jgi:hypothetical protein
VGAVYYLTMEPTELTPQAQAADIASLAAWVIYETRFCDMLEREAGLTPAECRLVMATEAN